MSADQWGDEVRIDYGPPTPPPPGFDTPGLNPIEDGKQLCPVPGCGERMTKNALGPHLKMHRNRNDPGTPPPKANSVAKQQREAKAKAKDAPVRAPYKPRVKPRVTAADVVDGVLTILFPVSIPTARAREVAAWIADTERLAATALAEQVEPPDEPS